MSKPLSPAAQAVKDAAQKMYTGRMARKMAWPLDLPVVAAALRAAIDAGRRGPEHWDGSRPDDFGKGWDEALDWIAGIAAELEAIND